MKGKRRNTTQEPLSCPEPWLPQLTHTDRVVRPLGGPGAAMEPAGALGSGAPTLAVYAEHGGGGEQITRPLARMYAHTEALFPTPNPLLLRG